MSCNGIRPIQTRGKRTAIRLSFLSHERVTGNVVYVRDGVVVCTRTYFPPWFMLIIIEFPLLVWC